MAELLEIKFLFRLMADNTFKIEASGNVSLEIRFDLKTKHVEDEDNVEAASKELLDLIERMRGGLNQTVNPLYR